MTQAWYKNGLRSLGQIVSKQSFQYSQEVSKTRNPSNHNQGKEGCYRELAYTLFSFSLSQVQFSLLFFLQSNTSFCLQLALHLRILQGRILKNTTLNTIVTLPAVIRKELKPSRRQRCYCFFLSTSFVQGSLDSRETIFWPFEVHSENLFAMQWKK